MCAAVGAVVVTTLAAGCGGDLYEKATVSGSVTCNGKPAVGGVVAFEPLDDPEKTGRPKGNPGRRSLGIVGEDGRFTLTYEGGGGDSDTEGAVIGPHRVSFILPQSTPWEWSRQDDWLPEEDKAKLKAELAEKPVYPKLECGSSITPANVEVAAGDNEFEFTLEPGGQASPAPIQVGGSD